MLFEHKINIRLLICFDRWAPLFNVKHTRRDERWMSLWAGSTTTGRWGYVEWSVEWVATAGQRRHGATEMKHQRSRNEEDSAHCRLFLGASSKLLQCIHYSVSCRVGRLVSVGELKGGIGGDYIDDDVMNHFSVQRGVQLECIRRINYIYPPM